MTSDEGQVCAVEGLVSASMVEAVPNRTAVGFGTYASQAVAAVEVRAAGAAWSRAATATGGTWTTAAV